MGLWLYMMTQIMFSICGVQSVRNRRCPDQGPWPLLTSLAFLSNPSLPQTIFLYFLSVVIPTHVFFNCRIITSSVSALFRGPKWGASVEPEPFAPGAEGQAYHDPYEFQEVHYLTGLGTARMGSLKAIDLNIDPSQTGRPPSVDGTKSRPKSSPDPVSPSLAHLPQPDPDANLSSSLTISEDGEESPRPDVSNEPDTPRRDGLAFHGGSSLTSIREDTLELGENSPTRRTARKAWAIVHAKMIASIRIRVSPVVKGGPPPSAETIALAAMYDEMEEEEEDAEEEGTYEENEPRF